MYLHGVFRLLFGEFDSVKVDADSSQHVRRSIAFLSSSSSSPSGRRLRLGRRHLHFAQVVRCTQQRRTWREKESTVESRYTGPKRNRNPPITKVQWFSSGGPEEIKNRLDFTKAVSYRGGICDCNTRQQVSDRSKTTFRPTTIYWKGGMGGGWYLPPGCGGLSRGGGWYNTTTQ